MTTQQTTVKNVLVATYGSLRRGMGNYWCNVRAEADYIGTGTTVENCDLYNYANRSFPALDIHSQNSGTPAVVDVFATTQAGLEGPYDGLEGYPGFYDRTLIKVNLGEEVVDAWIYHISNLEGRYERIEDGDWCKFLDPDYYSTLGTDSDDSEA